jgi:hypothetical protein
MNTRHFSIFFTCLLSVTHTIYGQAGDSLDRRLATIVADIGRMPERDRKLLPRGTQRLYENAKRALSRQATQTSDSHLQALSVAEIDSQTPTEDLAEAVASSAGPSLALVNNPGLDFKSSLIGGFTQDTTSAAWCGNQVLIGYLDSEQGTGFSISEDGGYHFTELGALPLNQVSFLGGTAPFIACSSGQFFTVRPSYTIDDPLTNSISFASTADGGRHWSAPHPVVSASSQDASFDNPSIIADQRRPAHLYIAYDRWSATSCSPDTEGTNLEVVHSNDGGRTWSAPTIVDQGCSGYNNYSPRLAVDRSGELVIVYKNQRFSDDDATILVRHSVNGGTKFSASTQIAVVKPLGSFLSLAGGLTIRLYPSLAIDPRTDALWLTWQTPGASRFDKNSSNNKYFYSEVVFSKSSDSGKTWSRPKPVGSEGSNTFHFDRFLPSVAVDHAGTVSVCYYDRRNDPVNLSVDRYCSKSFDKGDTWFDERETGASFPPDYSDDNNLGLDAQIGDFYSTVTDSTFDNTGFIDSFQLIRDGNPDIVARRF